MKQFGTLESLKSASLLCRVYLGLVVFSLAGSLLSRLTGLNPGVIAPVASALTIGVGFCALFQSNSEGARKTYLLVAAGLCLVTTIEITGLISGLPFGRYAYTDQWQPVVRLSSSWFPLMLPFAWLMVVGSSTVLCAKLRYPIFSAALLATMVDFVMEPVMTGPLRYWTWTTKGPLLGGASVLNPFGWFLTAAIVARLITVIQLENRRSAALVLSGYLVLLGGIAAIALIPR